MNRDVRDRWVTALRSGDYAQGRHALALHRGQPDDPSLTTYCCLGVLCDLAYRDGVVARVIQGDRFGYGAVVQTVVLPPEVVAWAELDRCDPVIDRVPLSTWNDGGGVEVFDADDAVLLDTLEVARVDLARIADLIEEHL